MRAVFFKSKVWVTFFAFLALLMVSGAETKLDQFNVKFNVNFYGIHGNELKAMMPKK